MSYLKRLADRMQSRSTTSLLHPKGLPAASPTSIARQPPELLDREPDPQSDEQLSSMRRQHAQDDEMAPQRSESEQSDEVAATLRRQSEQEDEAAPIRRQEPMEEPLEPTMPTPGAEVRPVRRQPPSEAVEAQRKATRRDETEPQPESEAEADEPAPRLRRQQEDEVLPVRRAEAEQDAPDSFDPDQSLVPEELTTEESPTDIRAAHRQVAPAAGPPTAGAAGGHEPVAASATLPAGNHDRENTGVMIPGAMTHSSKSERTTASSPAAGFERPQVIIDQIDVTVHEPAQKSARPSSRSNHSRLVRARYLKRY